MTARDRILSAIRAALPARASPETIEAEAASLLRDPDKTRPGLAAGTLAEAFIRKAEALGTTTERVAAMTQVPEAVGRYLDRHGLRASLALEGAAALTTLDWGEVEIHATLAPDEPVALGLARWGVAESGSLVVHSGAGTPILLSFLPLHHVVVLREADLLAHLEDYAARLAAVDSPRAVVLITGPSGTTDIEGSYVRGAHGPGFLHVILVGPS